MDLIFDVQVLPHRRSAELPEPVLASIAAVMLILLAALVVVLTVGI
ncbi:hypothetical protein [Mycolicibacterium sp. lyk4-40-TYG-92]|jgi:hypothetical protein|nr:hypothetical protein [Mycolicibacterium sp. lyk4-40-TYG-92]